MRAPYPHPVVLALALLGCGGATPAPGTGGEQPPSSATAPPAADASPWTQEARRGVRDPELGQLLADHWEWTMRTAPTWATELGDHRYDHLLPDLSEAGIALQREARKSFLAQARAVDRARLSAADGTTLDILVQSLEAAIATEVCEFETWNLSLYSNPMSRWNRLPDGHRLRSPSDGESLLARYEAIPRVMGETEENLRRGARAGRYTNAETAARLVEMFRNQLEQPTPDWALLKPTAQELPGFSERERLALQGQLMAAVDSHVRPAYARFADFVEREIMPHARDEAQSGVSALEDGAACYAATIRDHVGLPRTAEELHELGRREIARINGEMAELARRLFGVGDLPATLSRLRSDPELYFDSAEAVEQKAESALAKAVAQAPAFFGVLPQAACEVVRIPDYEAPYTTIAYYRQPHPDGSKPGEYFINVHEPTTRPRYEAEALAFHEAVPGHHLQIAIAQELQALPVFRRHISITAYVEGWALYTERLADEMGLYSGDLDRMGMLSYDAWRASRLVVDTGVHALGWSREQAVQYMLAHTALAENNIRNEVDRYISWPGQALAYKLGQLELLRLRHDAEQRLGDRFDLKGFHDTVLTGGAVPLPVLAKHVDRWVQTTLSAGQ